MKRKILVTGGCGFIGCNAAAKYLQKGYRVVVVDNVSRRGSGNNLEWLRGLGGRFQFVKADIRDAAALSKIFRTHRDASVVLHLAGQVAVTTSITDPRTDFEINALGTFNVLEAVRQNAPRAAFLFSSTNKVYGGMEGEKVVEKKTRYQYGSRPQGIREDFPLDFHSPYGCSKGTADQYVRDYSRIYGLRSVVFRQSCIYGLRQFGVEDQGWVAHFIIQILKGRKITVYGDGKQVRDVLDVQDLVRAYELAEQKIGRAQGRVFNIGGGRDNALSLLELLNFLESELQIRIRPGFQEERAGDQKIFISDNRSLQETLGWKVSTDWKSGVRRLLNWVANNPGLFP
jgi:CDP-paratose 2-epimerase